MRLIANNNNIFVFRIHNQQREDPNAIWKFPEDLTLSSTSGEMVVGGVYLRLLVSNPTWVLRKPKAFVSDLFDALLDQLSRCNDVSYGLHYDYLFCINIH